MEEHTFVMGDLLEMSKIFLEAGDYHRAEDCARTYIEEGMKTFFAEHFVESQLAEYICNTWLIVGGDAEDGHLQKMFEQLTFGSAEIMGGNFVIVLTGLERVLEHGIDTKEKLDKFCDYIGNHQFTTF